MGKSWYWNALEMVLSAGKKIILNTYGQHLPLQDLKDFAAQLDKHDCVSFHKLGMVAVPIEKIVGSVGRAHELNRHFYYRGRAITERFQRVMATIRKGEPIQPIKVYKLKRPRVSSEYYVFDGHHRLAAIIQEGYSDINAVVTEVRIHARKANSLRALLAVGALFHNRYRVEAQLGLGGAGAVYRVLDTRLDRRIALKIFVADGRKAEWRQRFRSEARIIAKLSHDSILRIYDFNAINDLFYLALEFIPGRDLWAMLAKRTDLLPLHASLRICQNILEALDYIHCQGVIHGDLKPENVMIRDAQFNICLTDFGLASTGVVNDTACEGIIAGSVYYLAPEVISGQRADQRSDLYALGVMLYELTTGQLPFYDKNPIQVMSQHRGTPPLLPTHLNTDLPASLEAVIMKLLAKHPEKRFQGAAEARAALDRIVLP